MREVLTRHMSNDSNRKMVSFRLDEKTRLALEKKAAQMGTSQSNAIGVILGVHPESAFSRLERRNRLITR